MILPWLSPTTILLPLGAIALDQGTCSVAVVLGVDGTGEVSGVGGTIPEDSVGSPAAVSGSSSWSPQLASAALQTRKTTSPTTGTLISKGATT